jgi:hypothetical protein
MAPYTLDHIAINSREHVRRWFDLAGRKMHNLTDAVHQETGKTLPFLADDDPGGGRRLGPLQSQATTEIENRDDDPP